MIWRSLSIHSEKVMAPHSSTLAWKIPWTEEPGRLQSMGSWRVGHDWATSLSLFCSGEGNGNPLQYSCPGTEKPGGLPSMGLHRVGHDWSDLAAAAASIHWGSWNISPVNKGLIALWKVQKTCILLYLEDVAVFCNLWYSNMC